MNRTVHVVQNNVQRQKMFQYFSGSHLDIGLKLILSCYYTWFCLINKVGVLFEYILSHSNRQKFVITEFLDLQQCHSRKSSEEEFKALINSIIPSKINSKNMKKAKKFAESMIKCNFDVLKSVEFFNYWDHKEKILARAIANNNYTTTALQMHRKWIK